MFYCVQGLGNDDKHYKLNKPYRILESDSEHIFRPNGCQGHSTIKELRSSCSIWKEYNKMDSISAQKICENRFILPKGRYEIFVPMDKEFNKVSYKIIKHTIMGELGKDIQGIHFLSILNPSIKKVSPLGNEDQNGVWKANITYYCEVRKKYYLKENSSMFPKFWNPNRLVMEIYGAFKNRKRCSENRDVYHAQTFSDIPVDFVFKDDDLRTVYPIYQL